MHEGTEATSRPLTRWFLNSVERKDLFTAFVFYLYVDEVNRPVMAKGGEPNCFPWPGVLRLAPLADSMNVEVSLVLVLVYWLVSCFLYSSRRE